MVFFLLGVQRIDVIYSENANFPDVWILAYSRERSWVGLLGTSYHYSLGNFNSISGSAQNNLNTGSLA